MMILSILQFLLCATCTCAIENLALRRPAWQENNFLSKPVIWGANKSVDGLYSNRSAGGNQCTISADREQTATLRVDLQRLVSISYINLYYRTENVASPGAYYDRFAGFFLYVSNTTSKEAGHLCFHEIQKVSGTPTEDQRINCSIYGRYVIYYNERRPDVTYPAYYSRYAFTDMCEVEVYGCPVPGYYGENCNQSCPENCRGQQCDAVSGYCVNGCLAGYQGSHCSYLNLALGRPSWQKNNWPGKPEWGAAKAVDGKYSDRSAIGNQCTISGPAQQTAEWRVDLQRVVSISHIHIYYRTENRPSPGAHYNTFAGFFLFVSNTTSKDGGHLCFHEIQNLNGTPSGDQRINCLVRGRYVIYYNERRQGVNYPSYYSTYAYNDLCELEVYGCPDSGYYGEYCDLLCSDKCQAKRCSITTGECLGCIPGYKGLVCSQKCDGGMYGGNCNQTCGHCINDSQCHHINGTCLEGCSSGYEGPLCVNVCRESYWGVNCKKSCSTDCFNHTCHHESGGCVMHVEPQKKCDSCVCNSDYTITIISIVVSFLIVITGSVMNYLIWRRNQHNATDFSTSRQADISNKISTLDITDPQSLGDKVTSPYAELGALEHPNTYDELHHYAKANDKM